MIREKYGSHSTTRSLTPEEPSPTLKPDHKFLPILFLPEKPGRQGEGGLRHRGLFKKSTDEKPLVTVVTVVFNDEKHLESTILSVIEQTYDNIEYIIIDGGSTDSTLEIILKYDDKIDYWISEKDECLYEAMNKAIEASTGVWLNFMNSGDLFTTRSIMSQTMELSKSGADIIYSDHYLYNAKNNMVKTVSCDAQRLHLLHQSMIYKRSLHEKFGMYIAKKNITIADYIFFNMLSRESFIKSPYPISKNLDGGISCSKSHIREKYAVDYLFNNRGILIIVVRVIAAHIRRLISSITNQNFS
jgi:glycosyltransferase involved in cell wall biosynthesis